MILTIKHLKILLIVSLVIFNFTKVTAQELKVGPGNFYFQSPKTKKKVKVWYYKPKNYQKNSRILFVMHGVKRNAKKYRDSWIRLVDKKGFLLLAPEFTHKNFPGSKAYNLGNMFKSKREKNDENKWSFTIIEDLFDYIKTRTKNSTGEYNIYGHSAGAQFVHRLLLFKPKARINIAIAANAGWYTMPSDTFQFPYGLKKSGQKETYLVNAFQKKLIILLGEKDTNKNAPHLRKSKQAMDQGKNRLERGIKFFQTAQKTAKSLKVEINWKLMTVNGVAHSNSSMAKETIKYFN